LKKVFISSVIEGFEDYRRAARRAVELTENAPVMAEDFGATPDSPQEACLQGVRESDLFLVLVGPRYGEPTKAGMSATEEEFEQAQQHRLPIIPLKTTESLEPQQEDFLRRIAPSWEEGSTYSRFTSPEDLKDAVVKALSHTARQGNSTHPGEQAFAGILDAVSSDREDVGLAFAFVPSPSKVGVPLGEVEQLGQLVVALSTRLDAVVDGDLHLGEKTVDLRRKDDVDAAFGAVVVENDLTAGVGIGLRNERRDGNALDFHYVDENGLRSAITKCVQFVSMLLREVDTQNTIRGGWIQCKIWGLQYKEIAPLPEEPVSSVTVPTEGPDELLFPSEPYRVIFRDMTDAEALASVLVGILERRVADQRRRLY